jgi:hypothetical protein
MNKIFYIFFLLIIGLNPLVFSQTRTLSVVSKNKTVIEMPYKQSYALLIGISKYTNGWSNIETIPNELEKLEEVLTAQGFHITKIMNPKGYELFQSYERFVDAYGYDPNNRLLFVYSGHGYSTNGGEKGYLVPSDAPNPSINLRAFKRQAMNIGRLLTLSREMESTHALFLFDSCFSGTIFKTKGLSTYPKYIQKSLAKPVRQFITSGSADEEVPAISSFMPMLRDGIQGDADLNKDHYVTGSELGIFLMQNLPNYENQTPQYGKIKDYRLSQGDFVFFPYENISIIDKKHIKLKSEGHLHKASRTQKSAMIEITTQPDNCEIKIYGKREYNYFKALLLPEGHYRVEVSKEGYLTDKKEVDLNQSLKLNITLEKERRMIKKMFFGF